VRYLRRVLPHTRYTTLFLDRMGKICILFWLPSKNILRVYHCRPVHNIFNQCPYQARPCSVWTIRPRSDVSYIFCRYDMSIHFLRVKYSIYPLLHPCGIDLWLEHVKRRRQFYYYYGFDILYFQQIERWCYEVWGYCENKF